MMTIEDVKLFPQGYSAIAMHPELIRGEPSILLMDIGGWTVDLMRLAGLKECGLPNPPESGAGHDPMCG